MAGAGLQVAAQIAALGLVMLDAPRHRPRNELPTLARRLAAPGVTELTVTHRRNARTLAFYLPRDPRIRLRVAPGDPALVLERRGDQVIRHPARFPQ